MLNILSDTKNETFEGDFPGDIADKLPGGDVVGLARLELDDAGVGALLEVGVLVEALLGLLVEGLQVGDGRGLGRVVGEDV